MPQQRLNSGVTGPPPTGTVTFLFTDIEGSTARWEEHRNEMAVAVRQHDRLVNEAIQNRGGYVFKRLGDAFCASFARVSDALDAAVEIQRALRSEEFSNVEGLKVRIALHTGEAEERDNDYFGPAVNRVARLLSAAHGEQMVLSSATAELARRADAGHYDIHHLGSYKLKDLAKSEDIYQLITHDLRREFPALRTEGTERHNLPRQLTSFVGRQDVVSEIASLLAEHPMVTLTGAGGVGKTRTALHVAEAMLESFKDGVWFVDLAPLDDSKLVPSAIASVFGVQDAGHRPVIDSLVLAIKSKRALLIFDNCEHVVDASAYAASRILRDCPTICILATSREPLGIPGEEPYRMPSLAVPPTNDRITAMEAMVYESVSLFVSRAQAHQRTFGLTDDNAPIVADIVRRLDGIALAIELASARVKILSVSEISKRLNERFKLLTGGSRTVLPRQQTLRALIAWSYDLLSEPEQSFLQQLSVFRDGCTLDAACDVCVDDRFDDWDVPSLLGALVDKSLVNCDIEQGESRYKLLESNRQFAHERLDDTGRNDAVLARHGAHYHNCAQDLWARYFTTNLHEWLAGARSELENYRAAIDWGFTRGNNIEAAADVISALAGLWFHSLRAEGFALIQGALTALPSGAAPGARGRLLLTFVLFSTDAGAETLGAATASLELAQALDRKMQVFALHNLAIALERAAQQSEALGRFNESLELAKSLNLPRYEAMLLTDMSTCLEGPESRQRRLEMLERALNIFRALGDRLRIWLVMARLAEARFEFGETESALECAQEALAIGREERDERTIMWMCMNIAAYELALGRPREAWQFVNEALEIALRREQPEQTTWILQHYAHIAAMVGDLRCAAHLIGHVDSSLEDPRQATEQTGYEHIMRMLSDGLPAIALNELLGEGARMDRATAVEEARRIPKPAAEVRTA